MTIDSDIGLLAARVCLSAVYFYSAFDKAINWQNAIKFVNGLRLNRPRAVVIGTIAVQLIGGTAVLLGIYTRAGALLLLLFTVLATIVAHNPIGLRGEEFRRQAMLSLEHLGIVGGLLLLSLTGAGHLAIAPP
jgi:putative oxidoreductase